jgi:hypothetical protein
LSSSEDCYVQISPQSLPPLERHAVQAAIDLSDASIESRGFHAPAFMIRSMYGNCSATELLPFDQVSRQEIDTPGSDHTDMHSFIRSVISLLSPVRGLVIFLLKGAWTSIPWPIIIVVSK